MEGKILIVDDDIDTLQLVGTMLERQGFKIAAANNGEKALELAQQEVPDLILLDIMMPGMDGYEVTRRLRSIEKTAYIPIVMFTAKAQVDDKVEGFEAGADDYLTKPTHPAELIARVRTILSRPKTGSLVLDEAVEGLQKGQVIGVLSTKGGLGASTLALNIGVSIHQQVKEYVTVAEVRPGQGGIGIFLGYSQSDGLNKLLRKNASEISLQDVEDELITHGSGIQLMLSSYNPSDASLMSAVEEFKVIIKHLSYINPYLIIDMGVGLPEANKEILNSCDDLIVIIEPTIYNIIQTKALLQNLTERQYESKSVHLVMLNRIRMEITLPTTEVEQELGHKLAGVVTPAPELAYQATIRQQPLVIHQPDSLPAQQINKLAKAIANPVKKPA
ncbi:MAG: response regulator [Chloroflexi bacterium]|nr:response regulator [Chloroflexota bacterium]